MKFRHEIIIDADQRSVWETFDNPENLKAWQPTLESFTRKSGEDGQPGAVAELVYDENGRKVTLIETITERREPHFMAGTYESDAGNALIVNHFEDTGDGRSRWAMYGKHSRDGYSGTEINPPTIMARPATAAPDGPCMATTRSGASSVFSAFSSRGPSVSAMKT